MMTSLEISALTVEFAWVIRSDIEDLIAVLSGHEGGGYSCELLACGAPPLNSYNTYAELSQRDSGFNNYYGDPDPANNQVHHTWFYIQLAYYHRRGTAWVGTVYHEFIEKADNGQSRQDYRAGVWGSRMGGHLASNKIGLLELATRLTVDLGGE